MPRPPRFLLSRSFYHIMTRGNNRNIVFKKSNDFEYYLHLIAKYKSELPFNLYHYCLMPNHTHFLIQTQNAHDFAVFMKKLNLAYFHYFARHYGWVGHFWQDRYKSQPVGKDAYFLQCGKYIELNPIRKGLVERPEDYLYSSYQFYALGKSNPLLIQDIFYRDLHRLASKRQKVYCKLLINEIVHQTYCAKAWGGVLQVRNEKEKIRYHSKHKINRFGF